MMRQPGGYATIVEPDRPLAEWDTCTCGHCTAVIFTKAGSASTVYLLPLAPGRFREEPGAFCRVCMRPVCLACHQIGTCTPFEQALERSEARDQLRRQAGV